MYNKIYLSGPDGAGKTTLADFFVGLGYKLMKWSKPQEGDNFTDRAEEQIAAKEKLVLDRGWLGDLVYAEVFGSKPIIDFDEALRLCLKFQANGGIMVYVKANTEELKERIKIRGDEYVTEEMIDKIFMRYEALYFMLEKNGVKFYTLDTTHAF